MKVEADLLVLCREASVGITTNELNITGLIDDILVDSFPATTGPFTLVARVNVSNKSVNDKNIRFDIEIVVPSGERMEATEGDDMVMILNPNETEEKLGFLTTLNGIPMVELGKYQVVLLADEKQIGHVAISVEKDEAKN